MRERLIDFSDTDSFKPQPAGEAKEARGEKDPRVAYLDKLVEEVLDYQRKRQEENEAPPPTGLMPIVSPPAAYRHIAAILYTSFKEGRIKPGDRTSAQRIADEQGVSRNPAYAALIVLETSGLGHFNPTQGFEFDEAPHIPRAAK